MTQFECWTLVVSSLSLVVSIVAFVAIWLQLQGANKSLKTSVYANMSAWVFEIEKVFLEYRPYFYDGQDIAPDNPDYLGYKPHTDAPILYWSLASDFTDEERRSLQQVAIDYHYDVGGFNFVYASFYIDTDRYSGAHVMMRKSHDRKSLRMLFGSAVASESLVHQRFGRENELVIEGLAGSGFIQDAACYHRASPPTHADRLMLQIGFR